MSRSLELFGNGRLYEIEDDLAIKVTETNGQVKALIDALNFSIAKTYNIHPPDKQPPETREIIKDLLISFLCGIR
jgi:hypothetical protein